MINPQKTVLYLEKKGFGKLRKNPQDKQWRRKTKITENYFGTGLICKLKIKS